MPVELWKAKSLNYRLITTVLQVTILSLGPLIANIGVKCCLYGTFMGGFKGILYTNDGEERWNKRRLDYSRLINNGFVRS